MIDDGDGEITQSTPELRKVCFLVSAMDFASDVCMDGNQITNFSNPHSPTNIRIFDFDLELLY